MDAVRVHLSNIDYRLLMWIGVYFFSYIRCQFLFQKAMPFSKFDYKLYVLFSVLYMRKTPIKQGK